jgi:hypothetical protein
MLVETGDKARILDKRNKTEKEKEKRFFMVKNSFSRVQFIEKHKKKTKIRMIFKFFGGLVSSKLGVVLLFLVGSWDGGATG